MREETREAVSTSGHGQAGATPPSDAVVLVVDDDAAVRALLQEALCLYGYRVVTAATAFEAEAIRRHLGPAGLRLVILDLDLSPDPEALAGYALYRRWAARHPALSFLLVSGNPESQALPAVRRGQVPFLAKPFTLSELLSAICTATR
ncbi:MAG: hypothetical protein KatS3mg131_1449 [Candidatus Tectimicrobiota bacterium]|nr:MAG: hypothetical protein KatS3mg131_1449 [Candidatus Tectomicrobia bacterium]